MRRTLRGAILTATLLCATPAFAQKSADTLRITWRDAVPDMTSTTTRSAPASSCTMPGTRWSIATPTRSRSGHCSPPHWKPVDDTTIDFTLRQGVTFQNGDKFSADDVVYTINSVLNDKMVVDAEQLPVHRRDEAGRLPCADELKRVFPAALEYIAMVLPIWPQAYREKVGVEQYSKQPIGAGPYRITKVDGTTEIDMERYDGYYADSPKGKPPIRSFIRSTKFPTAATEMAELLGGRADWIWDFSPDQFDSWRGCRTFRRCGPKRCASRISAWTRPAAPARTIR